MMTWTEFIERFHRKVLRVVIDDSPEFEALCAKLEAEGYSSGPVYDSILQRARCNRQAYPYLGRTCYYEVCCWRSEGDVNIIFASQIENELNFCGVTDEAAALLEVM